LQRSQSLDESGRDLNRRWRFSLSTDPINVEHKFNDSVAVDGEAAAGLIRLSRRIRRDALRVACEIPSQTMEQEPTRHILGARPASLRMSVVVPTYNRATLLACCLRSLEAQTLDKDAYEVFVVDDGSEDNTPEICRAFAQGATMRMTYVRGSHRGPAGARNLGIAEAGGEIVAFIDDDCAASEDWLEQISAPFRDPIVAGVEGKVLRHPDCTPFTHFVENLSGGLFLTANIAYRRDTLKALGGFDEIYPHAAAEDWDLAFRVREHGGMIAFQPDAIVVHAPVPVGGRHFVDRVKERRSAVMLYRRFPRHWQATTGRTMRRSFAEGIFLGPFVEVRKWRGYFLTHSSKLPRFLMWKFLASARLLVEYVRLRPVEPT